MGERGHRLSIRATFALIVGSSLAFAAPDSFAQTAAPIRLTWTAPGDDGSSGRASFYDIRYSTSNVSGTDTLTWWSNANQVTGEPAPGVAGSVDSMLVSGLSIGTTYYFIMKAGDEVPNWSGYSNVTSATVQSCDSPSNAPSNVAAVEDTAAVDVVLGWSGTPSPSDPSISVRIYRAIGAGSFSLRTTLQGTPTSYRDNSVNPGNTYRYQLAWGVTCGEGPRSSIVSITTAPSSSGPPTSSGTASGTLHVYPNPSSGPLNLVVTVNGTSAARAQIRLYTLTGKVVADLVDGTYDPGSHTVTWSRLSRTGQRVSAGLYVAKGTVGGAEVSERIALQ